MECQSEQLNCSSKLPNENAQKLAVQFAKHFGSPTSIWPNLNGLTSHTGNPLLSGCNGTPPLQQQPEHGTAYSHISGSSSTNKVGTRQQPHEGKSHVPTSSVSQLEDLLQSNQIPPHLLNLSADVLSHILSSVNAGFKGSLTNMCSTSVDSSLELTTQCNKEEKPFNAPYTSLFTMGLSASPAGTGARPLVYSEDGSLSGLSCITSVPSITNLPSLVAASGLSCLHNSAVKLSQSNHKSPLQSLIVPSSVVTTMNNLTTDDVTSVDSQNSSSRRAREAVLERLSASINAHQQKTSPPYPSSLQPSFENETSRNEEEDSSILNGAGKKQLCRVCGDTASGRHYGIHSCEGCKGFFKRAIRQKLNYKCRGNGDCKMDRFLRNRCQHCRLKKCYNVGMKSSSVQNERRPHRSSYTSDGDLSTPQYSNGECDLYVDGSNISAPLVNPTVSLHASVTVAQLGDTAKSSSSSLTGLAQTLLYHGYESRTVSQLLQDVKPGATFSQESSRNNNSDFNKGHRAAIEECNEIEIEDSVSDYQQTHQSMSIKGEGVCDSDGEDSIVSEEKTMGGSTTSGISVCRPSARIVRSRSDDRPPLCLGDASHRKVTQMHSSDSSIMSYQTHHTLATSHFLNTQDEVFRPQDDDHISTTSEPHHSAQKSSAQVSTNALRQSPHSQTHPNPSNSNGIGVSHREHISIPEVQHTIYQAFVHAMTFMKMLQIRDHSDKWIHFFLISLCQLLPGDKMHHFLQRLKQHVEVIGGIQNFPSCRAFKSELEKLDLACRSISCIHFSQSDYCILCKILLQDCYILSGSGLTTENTQKYFKATDELTHSLIQQYGFNGIQYVTRALLFLSHLKDINSEIIEELFFSGRTLPPLPLSTLIPFILSASVNVSSLALPKELVNATSSSQVLGVDTTVSVSASVSSSTACSIGASDSDERNQHLSSVINTIPLTNSIVASYLPVAQLISSVSPNLCISTSSLVSTPSLSTSSTTQPTAMSFFPISVTSSPNSIHEHLNKPLPSFFPHPAEMKSNHHRFSSCDEALAHNHSGGHHKFTTTNTAMANDDGGPEYGNCSPVPVTLMPMEFPNSNSIISAMTGSSSSIPLMKLSSQSLEESSHI